MVEVVDSVPLLSGDKEIKYLQTFYQNLVEAAGNVFFMTDNAGYFIHVNSAVEHVLGVKPSEMIGTRFTKWVAPSWRDEVIPFYINQFEHFIPETTLEFEVLNARGESRWIEQIVRLMVIDGQLMGCNGLLHDITPRKHAEQARQTAERTYVLASENSDSIAFMVSEGGALSYVNHAMEKATGYNRAELLGKNINSLIHPDHHEQIRNYVRLYREEKVLTPRAEVRFIRKDGSIAWLDVVVTWAEIGGDLRMLGSALDMSEHKRIEQQLRESQFFVEQINNTIPDMVYVLDLESWKNVYANHPLPTVLGYSEDEVNSMTVSDSVEIVIAEDRERYNQRIKKLRSLKRNQLQEDTFRMRHKDGGLRWLHIRNTPFEWNDKGRVTRVLGLIRDVTEQIENEEALRRSEEKSRKSLQYQRALNEINIELVDIDSVDEICKRAVEYGLKRLNFDRLGLLLYDERTEMIHGTFGTDNDGNLRDERDLVRPLSMFSDWLSELVRGKKRVSIRDNAPLYGDEGDVLGHGWNSIAVMWNGDRVMGWLSADNLVRHEPIQDYQIELLESYASALEHIYVRKRAEAALRESNNRYDQLVANMPGMVYRIRRDGQNKPYYEYLSPRCKDVTGLDPEAVLEDANLLVEQITPEDRVKYDKLVKTNLAEPQVFRWEGAVIINGERRWRRIESRPTHLPDGGNAWDGIMSDITESKRAEEALRLSEERYRTMVEEHSEMIRRYSPDHLFSFVNESVCRAFGQAHDYFIGRSILEDVPEEFHADILKRIELSGITGKAFQYEHQIKMPNGSLRWFEWTDTPRYDMDGKLTLFQSIGRDIDVRKRTESERNDYINRLEIIRRVDMELTESLNFEHVLRIALDAAVNISQASAGAIHVLENNKLKVAHVVGTLPPSMIGMSIALTKGIVGRVARRAVPELITDVNLDPDYMPNVVDTRAQMTLPLVSQDRLIGVINVQTSEAGIFTRPMFDFLKVLTVRIASALDNARLHLATENHLAEITDLYQQVTELEQLKTQMIRIAAHDLRNPLGVISGYIQMLTDEMAAQFTDRNRDQIAMIKDSINRIDKITRDILTLERIAAGRELAADRVDLKQMISEAFKQVRPQALLKRQTFELDTQGPSSYVNADRFLLPETVINLMTNAVKYTPEGGKIIVRLTEKDNCATFTVEDNGFGIPDDQQENLFQPFYRVKTKETRGINGTGLGLHLVKSIIERHKGRMYFQSVYKQGSTFGFEIPLADGGSNGHSKKPKTEK